MSSFLSPEEISRVMDAAHEFGVSGEIVDFAEWAIKNLWHTCPVDADTTSIATYSLPFGDPLASFPSIKKDESK